MNEAQEFFNKHGLEECKRAYALSVNAGCEDLDMKEIIKLATDVEEYFMQLRRKYKK